MRLLQPSALGRANVVGRVSNGTRQNVLMRGCGLCRLGADLVPTWCRLGADLFFLVEWNGRGGPQRELRAASFFL